MSKPLHHHLHDYFFPHARNNHRPHLFSVASLTVLAVAIVVFEAGYLVQTKIIFPQTGFLASVLPGALVALTNQDRAVSGLPGLVEDPLLDQAAQAAAADMAAKGYFAHVSPEGKEPWYWLDQAGYRYSYAGQNLAVDFSDSENVETAWMNSPTHRANIEKPHYTKIGIGTANGVFEGRETTFVVEFFATPAAAAEGAPSQGRSDVSAVSAPSPSRVLGTETANIDIESAQDAAPVALQPSAAPGWFAKLLAAPFTTLTALLTILLTVIAVSFAVALCIRGRLQHPSVAIGSAILFALISGALFISARVAGPVRLLADNQAVHASTVR